MPAVSPLFLFHARAGARLALRALVPVVAAVVGGWMLLGSDFLNSLAELFHGPAAGLGAAGAMTAALAGAAGVAAPRVCQGAAGWMRHLPALGAAHRRAAGLAVAVAQVPVLLLFCFLAFGAWHRHGARPLDLAALPLLAGAAALLVLPLERPLPTRILALAAAAAIGARDGGFLALGAGLLVAADLTAGPLAVIRARPRRGRSGGSHLPWRLGWRALGIQLAAAYLAGFLPLALATAFASHNQLAPREQRLAAVLGGILATVMFLAQAARAWRCGGRSGRGRGRCPGARRGGWAATPCSSASMPSPSPSWRGGSIRSAGWPSWRRSRRSPPWPPEPCRARQPGRPGRRARSCSPAPSRRPRRPRRPCSPGSPCCCWPPPLTVAGGACRLVAPLPEEPGERAALLEALARGEESGPATPPAR